MVHAAPAQRCADLTSIRIAARCESEGRQDRSFLVLVGSRERVRSVQVNYKCTSKLPWAVPTHRRPGGPGEPTYLKAQSPKAAHSFLSLQRHPALTHGCCPRALPPSGHRRRRRGDLAFRMTSGGALLILFIFLLPFSRSKFKYGFMDEATHPVFELRIEMALVATEI